MHDDDGLFVAELTGTATSRNALCSKDWLAGSLQLS
jgi:hypothetical protein